MCDYNCKTRSSLPLINVFIKKKKKSIGSISCCLFQDVLLEEQARREAALERSRRSVNYYKHGIPVSWTGLFN